jgi:shikimate kinase
VTADGRAGEGLGAEVASLALVGFMGSGKSAVGMAVAHRLRLPFVDTDGMIEEQMGAIDALFAERGEEYFRAIERDVCTAVLERAGALAMVVSLGGGAVLSGDVRAALGALAHVAWLTAPPDVLWERIGRPPADRRKASGGGTVEATSIRPLAVDRQGFLELYRRREPLYREVCTVAIENDGRRGLDEVVDALVERVKAS